MSKDYANCPYCQAELDLDGVSANWGFSPEGWMAMRGKHDKEHKKR